MFSFLRTILIVAAAASILIWYIRRGKKKTRHMLIAYLALAIISWLTIIFPPESFFLGFDSADEAYAYVSTTKSVDDVIQVNGKSSALIIENTTTGAVTPHLLIKKEQKWYITSEVLYSFRHVDDYWDAEYSVYCLSHPLINETYWMISDTSGSVNLFETVDSSGEYNNGENLKYIDAIGKKPFYFFCIESEHFPLYVNGMFAKDYYAR